MKRLLAILCVIITLHLVLSGFVQAAPLKVYVQWATNPPQDWQQTDCQAWSDLPKRPVPAVGRGQRGDDLDSPGWIAAINVVGTIVRGWDHYALEPDGEGCRVTGWNDDVEDFSMPWAEVALFLPPARDPKIGGRYNTRNYFKRYSDNQANERPGADFHPWSEFVKPRDDSVVRHGVYIPDDLWLLHQQRWPDHGWREWTDGIPAESIKDGLIAHALPEHSGHSVTRFLRDGLQANGAHTASDEFSIQSTAGAGETTSENVSVGTDELAVMWTLNEEAGGTWESNAAISFELSVGDSTASGGFLTVGGSAGHAACVNTGLTADTETDTQNESAFTMDAGIKAATFTTSWTSCNTTDKFEALLAVSCAADHGNCGLTWVYDSDSVLTVPYPAAAAIPKRRMLKM